VCFLPFRVALKFFLFFAKTDLARTVRTDETDKVHRESIGDSETVFDPHQGLRNDMNLGKDEHLPQVKGSDIDQDDQNRDGKGQSGAIQWSGHHGVLSNGMRRSALIPTMVSC
jgi:hypothetical protein